jgi:hypothetical protein
MRSTTVAPNQPSAAIPAWAWFVYFLRNGWVRFKAAFGLPIDVDKNFYAADAAWRLQRGLLPKGVKITVAGRSDGGGMQAMSRISGLNFAAAFGATYVHTPFLFVEHGQDGEVQARLWEAFLNAGEGEPAIADYQGEVVDYSDYFLRRAKLTDNTVLRFQQCYWPAKQNPATYYRIIPRLRQKLRFEPRKPNSGPLKIAVHVRRGDVSADVNNERFTDNSKVLAAVRQVVGALNVADLPFQITLHSQGDPEGFAQFVELGCALSLDADALWTLRQLMEADILVMSKSSFSFTAALVNAGVKLYEPWLHPPLPDWIVRRRDGSFDRRRFLDRLGVLMNGDDAVAPAARAAARSALRDEAPALSEGASE